MKPDLALLALLLASGAAQAQSPRAGSEPPVIACASLANLRLVLRNSHDDPVAAVPIIMDRKSDLGCHVVDRGTVTEIADHLTLNGKAYDCVGLQGTSICHWTVAGAVAPARAAPKPDINGAAPPQPAKSRR